MCSPSPIWRWLLLQLIVNDLLLARAKAGRSMPARIAMTSKHPNQGESANSTILGEVGTLHRLTVDVRRLINVLGHQAVLSTT